MSDMAYRNLVTDRTSSGRASLKSWMGRVGAVITLALVTVSVRSADWPQWRGPHFNGSGDARELPVQWTETENVKWRIPLPGPDAATPIVWNDRIFISTRDEQSGELLAICVNRGDGSELWKTKLGMGYSAGRRRHTLASPSPVTDGTHVYFLFGTGDLAKLDLDGNKIWERNLQSDYGEFTIQFGFASSPLLYRGKIYIPVLQRDRPTRNVRDKSRTGIESFLLALDPATGEELWRQIRPSDARAESREAYTTPIPHSANGRDEILVMGSDCIPGHDPDTGAELWRWGNYNPRKIGHWRIVPSPVSHGGLIYVSAPKREPVYALRSGGEGTLGDDSIAWTITEFPTDVCTPLIYRDRLYVLDGDRKVLSCFDPRSGERIWFGELGGKDVYRASPTGADGKIYCISQDGHVVVVAAGDEFKVLTQLEMAEAPCRATIVAVDRELLIRTGEYLYCIGT